MTLSASFRRRVAVAAVSSLILGTAGALATALPAFANTYTVDSLTDDGVGYTLREAIADANANPGPDVIQFDPSLLNSTLTVNSVLIITETLSIEGLGSGSLSIQRGAAVASSDIFAFQPSIADQDFSLSGITVQGNNVVTGSGVVANDNAQVPRDVTIDDVSFTDMKNTVLGGSAIILDTISGNFSVTNSYFTSNESGGSGGAILATGVGTSVVLTNDTLNGNISQHDGGAVKIAASSATVTITNSDFEENEAQATGAAGAVFVENSAGTTVDGSYFASNTSYNGGGGILIEGSTFATIESTFFVDNETTGNRGGGAAVGNMAGLVTVTGSRFILNKAVIGGGFATLDGPPLEIDATTFEQNSASTNGGAIHLADPGTTTISSTWFSGNTAVGTGGAIFVSPLDHSLTVDSSTFDSDSAASGLSIGVDQLNSGGHAVVVNSTADETQAGTAGVISANTVGAGSSLHVLYSTIVGALGLKLGSNLADVSVTSTIIGRQAAQIGAGTPIALSWSLLSSPLTATFTDGGGNQFGVADLKLGPLFDNGGPTVTMLPLAGSAAIDKGDPAVSGQPTHDQRGTGFPRVVGGRIDIGAVEGVSTLPNTGVTVNPALPAGAMLLLLAGLALLVVRRRRLG